MNKYLAQETLTSSPDTYTTGLDPPISCPSAIIAAIFQFKLRFGNNRELIQRRGLQLNKNKEIYILPVTTVYSCQHQDHPQPKPKNLQTQKDPHLK